MRRSTVRCRSCASKPAILDVVTRDGPELYTCGGTLVKLH